MNVPEIFKVKAFWVALSWVVAGVLGLLVVVGKLDPKWALDAGSILALFLAVLHGMDIDPQLKARLAARQEALGKTLKLNKKK